MIPNLLNIVRNFINDHESSPKTYLNSSDSQISPMVQVNMGLRDVRGLLWEIKAKLQEIDTQHQALQTHSSNAWREREELLSNYYDTLRAILYVLDHCENMLDSTPQISVVYEGLKRIMEEQYIEPIQVKEGDVFDAELYECEEIIESKNHPTDVVVQIIERGFMKKLKDGTRAVIRPVKVAVSKNVTHMGG
jgi:molecular chaperone GrpE (heat shock protein)